MRKAVPSTNVKLLSTRGYVADPKAVPSAPRGVRSLEWVIAAATGVRDCCLLFRRCVRRPLTPTHSSYHLAPWRLHTSHLSSVPYHCLTHDLIHCFSTFWKKKSRDVFIYWSEVKCYSRLFLSVLDITWKLKKVFIDTS